MARHKIIIDVDEGMKELLDIIAEKDDRNGRPHVARWILRNVLERVHLLGYGFYEENFGAKRVDERRQMTDRIRLACGVRGVIVDLANIWTSN